MKKTIMLSVFAFILISGACKNSSNKDVKENNANTTQVFNLDTTKLKSGETYYQCSMDPEIISNKSGQCPKCGMDLTEMKKQ